MNKKEAIEQLKNITSVPSMFIDETIKELVEVLKKPMTLEEFLGWEEGVEYKANCELYKIENDTLKIRYGKRWVDDYELHLNNYDSLVDAKKVEPKLKAWRVRDEYSFKCLIEELKGLKYKSIDYDWFLIQGGDIVIYDDKNEFTHSNYNYFSMKQKDNYNLIEYHKEEPRYLLQTDLTSENGVQYLSFDKKRRKYFIGALMTSKNVQQKFTDSEILKIESITRFAKLCEKVEVE